MKDGSTPLVLGTDYTVEYKDNVNVGTATVTVTGHGNYSGTASKTFTITEADAEQKFDMALTVDKLVYDGSGQEPGVIVKDGDDVLEKDKDYTLSYEDNINTGTGKVIVTGIGNYSGTLEMTFTIVKGEYTVTAPTAISPLAYNAKEQALVTAGTVNAGQILYSLDGETYGTVRYDMSGRRVTKTHRGLVIENGKRYVKK